MMRVTAAVAVLTLCASPGLAAEINFAFDVCELDPSGSGTSFDCALIEQTPTSPVGLFELELSGLDPDIASDAVVEVSSTAADLFQSDEQILTNGGGRNNPDEYFEMSLDTLFIGRLFDESDAELPADLLNDITTSIAAADSSVDPFFLSFTIAQADMAPFVSDGAVSLFLDFRFSDDEAYNVNLFRDVTFAINYEVGNPVAPVPLPAAGLLMLAGLGGLGLMRRRRRA